MIRLIILIAVFFWMTLELIAMSQFVSHFGLLGMFAETILSFVIGVKVLTTQPSGMLQKLQLEIAAGHDPKKFLFGRLRLFLSGVLFIIPGLISDVIALFLFISSYRSSEVSETNASPWTTQTTVEPQKDFDEAWEGDEFSKRMRKHNHQVEESEVVDAQIISSEDKKNDRPS